MLRKRLIISVMLFVPLLYTAIAYSVGLPLPQFMDGTYNAVAFAAVQIIISAAIMAVNRQYFISGFDGLVHKAPNMDTLVAAGSAAAFIYSIFAAAMIAWELSAGNTGEVQAYSADILFGSAGTILTLVTTGKYMESSLMSAGESISPELDMEGRVEDGPNAPIVKLAERIGGIFIPAVMLLALLTVTVWLLAGQTFGFALSMAISVLLISCPSALLLAAPVAMTVGTGIGTENGILFKSGESLEKAHGIDTVFLDKTGTVTKGKPRVVMGTIVPGMTKADLFTVSASIESMSEYPLAEAIVRLAKEKNLKLRTLNEFEAVSGKGARAVIGEKKYILGNISFLEANGIDCTSAYSVADNFVAMAATPVFLAGEGKLMGAMGIADEIRPTIKAAVKELETMGLEVIMLTGDNKKMADVLAEKLGFTGAIPLVLHGNKEKVIKKAQETGKLIALAADGVKDVQALAVADVGIAVGVGDGVFETADIALLKDDPLDIATAIKLSKAVIKNIKQNLIAAFFYNLIAIPIAAGVMYPLIGLKLDPVVAAAAMSLCSFCAVAYALRLRDFTPLLTCQNL